MNQRSSNEGVWIVGCGDLRKEFLSILKLQAVPVMLS